MRRQLDRDPSARPAQRQYNFGVWEQTHGSHEEAVRRFEHALSLEPTYPAARLELARMYAEGWGVPLDMPRAVTMLRSLAEDDAGGVGDLASINLVLLGLNTERVRELVPLPDLGAYLERAIASGHSELESLRYVFPMVSSWSTLPAWARRVPNSAAPTLQNYGGVWETEHTVPELVDGSVDPPVWAERETSSCVSVLADTDSIEVEINTASINYHHCLLEGRGGINAAGELIVETDQPLTIYGDVVPIQGPRCWVRFRAVGQQRLELAEIWPVECGRNPEWCGGRGEMLGHAFDRESRQPNARCERYDGVRGR
ncbi:MAG: tetratricopeptide repeat protein [Polyangiales bacterium]